MKPAFTLQPDETLEQELRTSLVLWLPKWIFGLVVVLTDFFFMTRLFREGTIGIALFLLFLLIGLLVGGRAWVQYKRSRLLITSQRVISVRQAGFFEQTKREIPLRAIESVSSRRKGFFQAIFRYGKLKIETKGHGRLVFGSLPHPERVQERISSFIHDEGVYETS